jgi:hypothetical protein
VRKYKCGRCSFGSDDLQQFGDHPCTEDNPVLAALGVVISLPDFTIDLGKLVLEKIEQHKVNSVVNSLEDALRQGNL